MLRYLNLIFVTLTTWLQSNLFETCHCGIFFPKSRLNGQVLRVLTRNIEKSNFTFKPTALNRFLLISTDLLNAISAKHHFFFSFFQHHLNVFLLTLPIYGILCCHPITFTFHSTLNFLCI